MRINIDKAVDEAVQEISNQVKARAYRAANELRNSALFVLKGERSGRVYRVPFTKSAKYRASAPGEPPAQRSGRLRMSWRPQIGSESTGKTLTVKPAIITDVKYAPILQEGTKDGRIKPRPFEEPIIEHAVPRIQQIFKEPY
jgi:hypothetical protein